MISKKFRPNFHKRKPHQRIDKSWWNGTWYKTERNNVNLLSEFFSVKPLPDKICVKLLWDKCFQSLVNVEVHYPPID